MNRVNHGRLLAATASLLSIAGLVSSTPAKAAPDHNLAISFTALPTQINWQLTGPDVNAAGVAGTLGPFNNACANLQGLPATSGEVMTRAVYVLDAGNAGSNAVLYVYTRTDTITVADGQTSNSVTGNGPRFRLGRIQ
jgi:hypothetical protein